MLRKILGSILVLAVLSQARDKPEWFKTELILSSPRVTNFGTWFPWVECPAHTYVTGMQVKRQHYQGTFKDDAAMTGIELKCGELGSRHANKTIMSGDHSWGNFGRHYQCEGVASGFQLRSESYQTPFADDTAANNIRLFCNNELTSYIEGDGLGFGDWTQPQQCFNKQAICGFQTQIESANDGNGDVTGLNNIKVKCCDVPNPAVDCVPTDEYQLILGCDNTHGTTELTCTYQRKVGVSHSTTSSESYYELSEIYHDLGFTLDAAISVLSFNFEYNLDISEKTGYNWTQSNTEVWSVETVTTYSFEVPPQTSSELSQIVGSCGIYNAQTNVVRRIDTNTVTGEQKITLI